VAFRDKGSFLLFFHNYVSLTIKNLNNYDEISQRAEEKFQLIYFPLGRYIIEIQAENMS
jgi:hypothetical protein